MTAVKIKNGAIVYHYPVGIGSVQKFIAEKCQFNTNAAWACTDLYQSFEKWRYTVGLTNQKLHELSTHSGRQRDFFTHLYKTTNLERVRITDSGKRRYYVLGLEPNT